jgi:hypothetical protein
MKFQILFLLVLLSAAACAPRIHPSPAPTEPVMTSLATNTSEPMQNLPLPEPGDPKFTRGNIFIEDSGLMIRESYPPQISLNLSGNLPTPCHQFRADVSAPDVDNKINVDVYTVVDPNMMCIQVLKAFTESVSLGTFLPGHYSVWVNGESVGEFDS